MVISTTWEIALTLLVCFMMASSVSAVESAETTAKSFFVAGNALAKEENYQEALASFERSYAVSPRKVVLFNIAMCLKALDRLIEASSYLKRYLAETDETPIPDLRPQARETLSTLEKDIPRLYLGGVTDSATVFINDEPLSLTPGKPISLDPGQYQIKVTAPGFIPFETGYIAEARTEKRLDVKMIEEATLSVECNIEGAAVYVDNVEKGTCPVHLSSPGGAHSLRVSAPFKETFEEIVTLTPGLTTRMTIHLTAVQPRLPGRQNGNRKDRDRSGDRETSLHRSTRAGSSIRRFERYGLSGRQGWHWEGLSLLGRPTAYTKKRARKETS